MNTDPTTPTTDPITGREWGAFLIGFGVGGIVLLVFELLLQRFSA